MQHHTTADVIRAALALGHRRVSCAWCQAVCCVHGAKLGALRQGKRIYCAAECYMQAGNARGSARRRAARQEGSV